MTDVRCNMLRIPFPQALAKTGGQRLDQLAVYSCHLAKIHRLERRGCRHAPGRDPCRREPRRYMGDQWLSMHRQPVSPLCTPWQRQRHQASWEIGAAMLRLLTFLTRNMVSPP